MKPVTLIKSIRDGLVEREHYGFILVMGQDKTIKYNIGYTDNYECFLRSCAKPFQALPVLLSKAFDFYNLSLEELAVCCASHSGSKIHTDAVYSILKKIGLDESFLLCGSHPPLDKETRDYLLKNNINLSPVYNNCSGKHAGMLAVCKKQNWDLDTYLDKEHPLQIWIRDLTIKYCELDKKYYKETLDGCGTPVGGMSLEKMSKGYLNLLLNNEAEKIIDAFRYNHLLIGGDNRLDSLIIKYSNNNLMAKVGAEGLCIVLNIDKKEVLTVKITDANMQARSIAVIESLIQLGWIDKKDIFNKEGCKKHLNLDLKTLHGEVIGEVKPVFSLSVPISN